MEHHEPGSQEQHEMSHIVDFDFVPPSMEELILDYLEGRADVTFVDLEDDVPGFQGELSLKFPDNRKTILWQGISPSALHALHALEQQRRIRFEDASPELYHDKGRALNLPVDEWQATRVHWTPVLVGLTPGQDRDANAGPVQH